MTNYGIKCTLAKIRKCRGIIFNVYSEDVNKLNECLFDLQDKGYLLYHLRHSEDDRSKPHTIKKDNVIYNRYGFFATKDIMKFKNFKNEITINKKNSTFYILEDNGEITKVEKFYLAENQTAIDSILKDEEILLNL